MQAVGRSVLTRGGRVVVATAGLMVLLALQPESVRLVEPAAAGLAPSARAVRTLIISEQARRYLALQYRSFPTEFMGCMIGEVRGSTVIVQRVAPADVDPPQSTATHVVPKQTCEQAGWQPYPVDAIMCGDDVVWIARNMVQQQVPLTDQSKRANVTREQPRGNRVHAGSASRTGVDE